MNTFCENFEYTKRFTKQIKAILGENLIRESSDIEDKFHATDFMCLKLENVRIACRIRRFKYLKYNNEFTIRSSVKSGAKSELSKIIEGWGDYLLYGFSDENEKEIVYYKIIDLKKFRLWFVRKLYSNENLIWKDNNDGSKFLVVPISDLEFRDSQ